MLHARFSYRLSRLGRGPDWLRPITYQQQFETPFQKWKCVLDRLWKEVWNRFKLKLNIILKKSVKVMNLKWEQGRFYFVDYIFGQRALLQSFFNNLWFVFGKIAIFRYWYDVNVTNVSHISQVTRGAYSAISFIFLEGYPFYVLFWWRQYDVIVRSWWRHNIKWFTDSFPAFNVFKLYAVGCNWKVRWFEKSTSNATSQPRLSWFSCDNTW